jgi:hypothetical protein
MPGSNQRTRLSSETIQANGEQVIEFLESPRYRRNAVEVAAASHVRCYGFIELSGQTEPGIRAIVDHVSQHSSRCKVLVQAGTYVVHPQYHGAVSLGVEEF